ncbi:PIN domain-containing protein [Pararhizobium qamdonense]|uniref:PIN domain-containing protein n=1 Tax=Pararhizobium qamdonense TaxID=3031126 RepID=UPI0023E26F7C|nr:PIN domain-containing protein [Pararhizobium qamdonense]
MFLIDTNVLSHAQKPKQNPTIREWFSRQDSLAIPFPVLLEIQQGIVELGKRQPDRAADLSGWLDTVLASDFVYPTITPAVARVLAEMNCCNALRGLWQTNGSKEKKPGQDLFIAAIAIIHNLPIATCDVDDFVLINDFFPLPGVYNPAFNMWLVTPGAAVRATSTQANYQKYAG